MAIAPPAPAPAPAPLGRADGLSYPFDAPPEVGTVREIAPGLLWLRLALPYRLNHVNIYLLWDTTGWAVVDTGLGDERTRLAWQALLAGPLQGAALTRLIVTHYHPDHVGLAGWLCEEHGLPLFMPRTEYLFSVALQAEIRAQDHALHREFYRQHGLSDVVTEDVLSRGHEYLRSTTGVPSVFRRLRHGQELRVGERVFQVLTGGGHALEQAMLYCAHDRLFLSADQVIAQISPNVSVLAIEPEANALGSYLRSLRALPDEVPGDVLVLPGHGLPFRGLHSRTETLIKHHHGRFALIDEACRTAACSVAELIPVLFKRELDPHQTGFAFGEALAHVNYMLARNDLRVTGGTGVRRYRSASA